MTRSKDATPLEIDFYRRSKDKQQRLIALQVQADSLQRLMRMFIANPSFNNTDELSIAMQAYADLYATFKDVNADVHLLD